MTHRPGAIILDVNETLSDLGPLEESFEAEGLPSIAARSWFAGILRDGFALTVTGDNPDFAGLAKNSLARLCADALGQHGNSSAAVESVMSVMNSLPVHDDVVPGINALAELAALVTLSNGAASVGDSLLKRAGVRERFERLLSVADAGRWKPAPEAYYFAAAQLDLEPSELLLVAVHPWDIHGAKRAGLRTAWINRSGGLYPDFFDTPELEVSSLTELAERLSRP